MRGLIKEKHFDKSNLFNWGNKISKIKELGGNHNLRVAEIVYLLSKNMNIGELYREKIYIGALVHDAGKALIPKKILSKPCQLSTKEMKIIKKHPEMGLKIIKTEDSVIKNIILHHHERFDGSGYPYGLKNNEIPFESQLIMICDIYDALRSDRAYKKIFSHEEALDAIKNGDNRINPNFYNPIILENFLQMKKQIKNLYDSYNLAN